MEVVHLDEVVQLRVVGAEESRLGLVQRGERIPGRGGELDLAGVVCNGPQVGPRLPGETRHDRVRPPEERRVIADLVRPRRGERTFLLDEPRHAALFRELDVAVRVAAEHVVTPAAREDEVLSEQAAGWDPDVLDLAETEALRDRVELIGIDDAEAFGILGRLKRRHGAHGRRSSTRCGSRSPPRRHRR